ncbi:hypothetical protein GCM10023184_10140 [Flaviaesturariibacter amylovorans]|uniref:T9SS type A sorting domain-containing protein n=1 Tax=Flaviaesturariibacter amylovorans TaxID=1084520 RepID=A0ABP8GG53_9BACT
MLCLGIYSGLLAQPPGTGTADGTYDFRNLGADNSGGTGFKTQGDKFEVSNKLIPDAGNSMYVDNRTQGAIETVVIRAEGGSVLRTFTFRNMQVDIFGNQITRNLSVFTVRVYDYSGGLIGERSLAAAQPLTEQLTNISTFNYTTPWPANGFPNAASVEISWQLLEQGNQPDDMTFWNITISNASASVPTGLTMGSLSGTTFCAGATLSIPFTASGMNAGNTYTAQLSNSAGSFAAPTAIGAISSNATSGTISATLPSNISGTGYRIRLTSSSPSTTSTDNGSNLTINPSPSASSVVTNVACFGGNTGAINLTPTGGTPGYIFLWNGGATSEDRTGLTAGTYSVTITDAAGCTNTINNISVSQPASALSASSAITDVACFGGNTGAINITPSGGTPGYSYNWGGGVTTEDRTNLVAGTYGLVITDANGCATTLFPLSVGQPSAVLSGSTVVTNVACFGGNTGAINLTPSGGAGSYTFLWNNGTTTEDRTNLTAGTYSVTITDANNCQSTISNISVGQPASAVSGTTGVTSVACFGGNTGSIDLTPAGGTPGYTYMWNGGATSQDRSNLTAGNYSVTITDANNCQATISNISVGQPSAAVSGSTVVTNVACFGGNTGAINLTPAGGTPGYTFVWDNGATTEDRTNLTAGTYSVTITDANNCQSTVSNISVGQPGAALSGSTVVTNVACFGGTTGTIDLTPTGGTAGYSYLWNDGATSQDRSGLAAGTYSVTITDANGCETTIANISVGQPATAISGSTIVTNVACFGSSTGTINLTPTGGTPGYTFLWNNGVTTEDRSGLAAGTYSVTITDANGCETTVSNITIDQPSSAVSGATVVSNVTCNGAANGSINLTPTGGTPGYSFLWNDGVTTEDRSGLNGGSYAVTITDDNGCESTVSNISVSEPDALLVNAVGNQSVCAGGNTAAISFTGNATTYEWTNNNTAIGLAASGTGNIGSFATVNNGISAETATITVTPTSGACSGTPISFTITVGAAPTASIAYSGSPFCTGGTSVDATVTGSTGGNFSASPAGLSINSATGAIDPSASAPGTYTVTYSFAASGSCPQFTTTTTVEIQASFNATIAYPGTPFCDATGTVLPTQSGTTGGSWSAAPAGLSINPATGAVDLDASTPGVYTVSYGIGAGGGCGAAATTQIAVRPTYLMVPENNQVVCAGSATAPANFSTLTGVSVTWTNNNPSIGLAASGSGNIPAFTAVNNGTTMEEAVIAVTPTGGTGCPIKALVFRITVRPMPTVNTVLGQTVCAGSMTQPVTFTGALPGSIFSWTNDNTAIGLGSIGTGNIAAFTAQNQTATTQVANVTVTPRANSCSGMPMTFTISTQPSAGAISYGGSPYCPAGAAYPSHLGSGGGTYTSAPAGLLMNSSTGEVNLALSNPGTYSVTYTLTDATCSGIATTQITILPGAQMDAPSNPVYCNGASAPAQLFTGAAGYTWTNDNPSIGLAASGSGSLPSFVAVNNTAAPVYAFINVTPQGNGTTTCTGKPVRFRITVNPTPTATNPGNQVYCRGIVTAPVPLTGNMGTEATYNWTSSTTATGLLQRRGADVVPAFTTVNPTAGTVSTTITVTPVANKCVGAPITFQYQVGNCVAQNGGGTGEGGTDAARSATFAATVSAAPNPARDQVTLQVLNARKAAAYTVQVINAWGSPVGRPQAFGGTNCTVSLAGLTPGNYVLLVTDTRSGESKRKQIVKL